MFRTRETRLAAGPRPRHSLGEQAAMRVCFRSVRSRVVVGGAAGRQAGSVPEPSQLYSHVHYCTIAVMVMMNVSEARSALPDLLSRVEGGEEVTITRHGRPVAVLVRPDALRSRRARAALDGAEAIHQLLAAAAPAAPEGGGLNEDRAEELIAEIRAGRDAR